MKILSSYHQQRLWFIDHFEKDDLYEGGPIYHNIPIIVNIDKDVDSSLLKDAFIMLLKNNDILRTRLHKEDEGIFQCVSSIDEMKIDEMFVHQNGLNEALEVLRSIPFDFDNDHLVKCYYEHRENQTVVYFVIHHALIDRRSIKLIQEQYLSLLTNENSLSDTNIQYSNFSNWQNGLTEEDYESLLFHWKSKLKDVQVLYFSTDREREQVHIYKANHTSLSIDRNKIASFCEAKGISSRNLFLSAYKMALSRLTGLSDIVIGTLMDLRNEQINTLIGPIENLVVLRSFIDSNKSLFDLNKTVENEWNEAECFKTMPFDKLVLEINPKKDMSRTALFDVLFMYENNDGAQVDITTNQGWGKYDFNLLVSENENKFELNLVYNDLYFNKNTVVSLLDLVQRIIITTIENENTLLKDISLVSEEEYNKLTSTTNESIQLGETSIVQRFLDQVKVHPDNIGISWSSGEMTYEELDKKSTQLANFLINTNAIGLEDKVAVVLPKTENLIITILAVLKTGAAYVPIDPSYPEDRKTFIIEDASCKVLIDESFINDSLDLILNESTTLPKVAIKNDNLAYIIYTSGTTGRPKGVMIEHGNVLSLLDSCFVEFEVSEKDVWTLFHSYCFDFSVWELFGGLLTGANVLIISNEEARNQEVFTQLMREYEVTVFSQTPSAFYNFIALESQIPTLRYVVFGGEALNPFKIKDWSDANPQVKLINMYGITETTVHVTYKELTREELSSSLSNIGKPLLFANCYVLDQEQSLLPYGRSGELYISGEGVARGYLNRPDVQEDKFVLCPFDDNEKMYRTGDLVRFMPSGELEYLGRIDDQVKVRGYRIELDEIKKQIDTYSGVQQSAVSLIEMPDGDKSIAAYITLTNQHSISDLKLHLSTKIPEYMIPSFFVKMDEIPINSNGKVDKTKLPSPLDSQSNETQEIIPPSTDLEIKLHEIWSSLLNTERFGLKHNFFELGGHSLKATRLIAAIHKAFEVRLELKQIFANPTLEDQANLISLSTVVDYEKIEKVADQEYYPVSDAQKRLWLLSQLEESSIAYNIPDYKTLHGEYDIESFDKAINATIERHEILRTIFKADENGNVYQYVLPTNTLDFKITYLDYSKNDHKEEDVKKYITNDSSQAFDLENGPLLRATLIMLAQDHYVFYYNLHHIISDGWSKDVLIKDTLAFYEAYKENAKVNLPELNIQYKDYAAWQLAQLETASSKEARQYWTENLSGELPLLDLPTKKIRPKVRNYNGERLITYISSEDTNRLKLFTQNNGGSLFMGLLSVWNVLFYKYTSLKDVIVGTPIAGRDHIDLENQIGFYINTLALRNNVNPEETFKDFFTKVKESTLAAYKHQSYPFDRLVNDLELRRDTSRNAVFDVMMTLQNANDIVGEIELSENDIQDIVVSPCKAKFDVDIKFKEIGECLYLDVSYNKDVYDQYIIEGLIKHYKQLLQVLMIQSEDAIAQINYLSEDEQEMLLVSFNDTEASYPKDKTLVDLFAVQVEQNADEVAVIFEETELTYRELDELSDDLANYLLSNYAIASDDLIGIKLDRSEWMIIAILAVLKTGGAYVPIDPSYPEDRIAYIESDSNCKVSIDAAFIETFRVSETKINTNHNVEITPANLAYVIYTSGSTGQPKGVMIEQASLINYLTQASSQYLSTEISNFDFGLFTSLSFDLTVTSIFLPLINGGTLKVYQSEIETSVILKEYIENQISCIKLTPSHISLLANMNIEQCGVEVVIVGGEELQKTHVKALKEINPSIKIFNEYGPTESTVGCIVHEVISLDDAIIIGYPINNTTAYILSDTNSLQPVGVIGELCLGGDGLARGYLNRPELTSEKFVENRFRESGLLYKTGDLARWLPDGSIDFLGRKDDQVKIRGHRIELGEIEQHLGSKPGISEVCVLARVSDMGTKELIAYLVSEVEEDVSGLRSYLSDILPDYMLPSYYVQVGAMPLTSNG
ncbi:non-ribosomal peptide synthetase, partial [Dokdonia pacifica]